MDGKYLVRSNNKNKNRNNSNNNSSKQQQKNFEFFMRFLLGLMIQKNIF